MKIINNFLQKLFFYIQTILILFFLIFEELTWERFAKPIFRYIKYLKPFEKLEKILNNTNKYIVLILFIVSLLIGECLSLLSPIVLLEGYTLLAIVIYIIKLLITAFAFWIFTTQKNVLLSFDWLAYMYKNIILIVDWIKTTEVYKSVIYTAKRVKVYLKLRYRNFKNYMLTRFWF